MNLFFDTKYQYEIAADVASLEQFFDKKCEEDIYNDSLLGHSVKYQLNKEYKIYQLEFSESELLSRSLFNIHLIFELKPIYEQTVDIKCVTKYCITSKMIILGFYISFVIAGILYLYYHPNSFEFKEFSILVLKAFGSFSVLVGILFLQIKWDLYAHKEILEKFIKEFEKQKVN